MGELSNKTEHKARLILKQKGYILQRPDWVAKRNDKYIIIEVKERELFKPPPFSGTGLDINQLNLRMQLLKDLSLRTFLMVFERNSSNIYGQFLDILELGKHKDTKNKIRIYPIENYNKF